MLFIVGMTATLVERGFNRLRYLISALIQDVPSSVSITTLGAPSPDLLTDSKYGPIKQCARAFASGLGKLAAGPLTQAQARAIWLADRSDTVLGNGKVPRCVCNLLYRDPSGLNGWTVEADVDASGHPFVIVTNNSNAGDAYLDVYTDGSIGI